MIPIIKTVIDAHFNNVLLTKFEGGLIIPRRKLIPFPATFEDNRVYFFSYYFVMEYKLTVNAGFIRRLRE
jgi:hypothetical protein